jgi:hypothetical protein
MSGASELYREPVPFTVELESSDESLEQDIKFESTARDESSATKWKNFFMYKISLI